jgi:glycosyltransferase involved in cell wall biosynthesis
VSDAVKKPHRILLLITSSGTGGAENLFKELTLRLDPQRMEPFFCSLRPSGATARELELKGVPVFSLDMSESPNLVEMIRGLSRLNSLCRTHSIDLVQTSLYRANVLAVLASAVGKSVPKVVTSQHSLSPLSGRLAVLLTRHAHRYSDRVVAVSEAVRRYLTDSEGIQRDQIVVIPNGVDTQRFRPRDKSAIRKSLGIADHEVVIGAAGRLTPVKGFDTLIEAASRLYESGIAARVLIAGEGPERNRLQALITEAGLGRQIQLLGLRNDLASLYSAFDVFVLSSLREGSPGVVLEAMASECPVVATAVGGVPEIIQDRRSGLLVPPGDAESLASSLAELLGNGSQRDLLAHSGRARVQDRFSLDRIADQYEELYSEILRGS